ncbi:hypothetical protein H5A38_06720 [Pectobacterium brasiliense]|nr:hypothetical protein H5A38_06720 [Pectobacterium brasiliense]
MYFYYYFARCISPYGRVVTTERNLSAEGLQIKIK